jgi:hypothetical protein
VFDASPDLFLDEEQRHEAFGQFMDYVAQHEVRAALRHAAGRCAAGHMRLPPA